MDMPPTQERSIPTTQLSWSTREPVGSSLTAARSRVDTLLGAVADQCRRHGPTALRLSLALVFLWFGALKLSGDSPVAGLIAATLPFVDPATSVPVLGVVEVLLAVAVVVGRAPRMTLLVLAAHLTGTFLSFLTAPELVFGQGNLLLLTADGEFVLKNLVLVSAALVLVGHAGHRTPGARHP